MKVSRLCEEAQSLAVAENRWIESASSQPKTFSDRSSSAELQVFLNFHLHSERTLGAPPHDLAIWKQIIGPAKGGFLAVQEFVGLK